MKAIAVPLASHRRAAGANVGRSIGLLSVAIQPRARRAAASAQQQQGASHD
jgi:hypothetical protein